MQMRFFAALTVVLLITGGALAGPKEDVTAATAKWGETLGQNDPDKVVALYAPDAVLWGTISPTVRSDRGAIREYFVGAFKALPASGSFSASSWCESTATPASTPAITRFRTQKTAKQRRSPPATALRWSTTATASG